jgi:hypothetical protein
MNGSPLIHFEIRGATLDDLRAFADETQADLGCRGIARKEGEQYAIDAFLPEDELTAARNSRAAERVTLRTIENLTAVGQERQTEVGTGNRFAARAEPVRGLGEKR